MFLHLRRLLAGDDTVRARRAHRRLSEQLDPLVLEQRRLFLRATLASEGDGRLLLGRVEDHRGDWRWCGLSFDRLFGGDNVLHALITGSSGSGKSRLIAALLSVLFCRMPCILWDNKSELAQIAILILEWLRASGVEIPLRKIQPFETGRVPLLRLTEPEPGTSREIQALSLAESLNEAVGSDAGLGIRMHRIFLAGSSLAVEKNVPLMQLAHWLGNPVVFAREARTSADSRVRDYVLNDFPRENKSSIAALRARLDELFHLRDVRLALSAPSCLSLRDCLESGVTIIDAGSPPAGAEKAMRLLVGPLMGRLMRAVLSRPVRPDTAPALVLFEEAQEQLSHGRYQVDQFKRLLALARFKRTPLWFSAQQIGQIADVDPMLLRILRTNTTLECCFRSSAEDAVKLAQGFAFRRSKESIAQARQRFVEELSSLPRRNYFLWLKDESFGPQRIVSPRFDLEPLQRAGRQLPPEMAAAIRFGTASVPESEVHEMESGEVPELPTLKSRKPTKGIG